MHDSVPTPPLRIALNDGWTVRRPAGPFAAFNGGLAQPTPVTLPHDAMRDSERTPTADSGAGTGYYPSGGWTYLREFEAPAGWRGRWVALEVDGAASHAIVYVNGAPVATRPNGYARFFVEIGPHLRYGASNEIRIEVRAHKDSRWYPGAGLYRGVKLIVAGATHIIGDGVTITTPDVDDELAAVDVETRLRNDSNLVHTVRVTATIAGPEGTPLDTVSAPATVFPGETSVVRQRLFVRSPRRWSVSDPLLHTADVRVTDGDVVLDSLRTEFGIRTLRVDPFHGLRINGGAVKLRGTCLHHDNGPLGGTSFPAAEERRLRRLKDAGFNAIRTAHNPASQALLDACDRVGMLVMNEAFDMWQHEKNEFDYARDFAEWWERDIEAMVYGSRNHPSVIMYSIGNEILELGLPSGANLNRRIAEKVRACDGTRPVTNGINTFLTVDAGPIIEAAGGLNALMGGDGDASNIFSQVAASPQVSQAIEETASALDITGYNYAESRYEIDSREHPNRVLVGSETFPTAIATNWALVMAHPQVIGDFTWTGWDYLGEAGIGGAAYAEVPGHLAQFAREYPYLTAYCGDFDITGHRRPASYYREMVFGLRSQPYIAVQRPEHHDHTRVATNAWGWTDTVASWSWAGFEGRPIRVEVYADADQVELLCNGESVGRSSVGTRMPLVADFDITYAPGDLVAVAYRGGSECGRSTLRSASGSLLLHVAAERESVAADGLDLAYVDIAIADADGVVPCNADRPVTVQVHGPAVLAGFCSADPQTTERFDASTRTTFDGRALAVLRATGAGRITVQVSTNGMEPKTVTIEAH